jgi:DNA-binding beta-propeller fold protein YncE
VRKVSAGEYRVTAHAGLLGAIGSGDGPASQARFFNPWDVDVAADGTVYVVDENNHVVQKIANGQVTTVARTHDELRSFGLAVAQEDTIWVSESQSSTIRRATLAGGEPYIGARLEAGNRPGGAGRARLSRATGIDLGPSGRLVIADTDNAVVKVAEVVHGPWIDELIALPASTAGDSPVRLEWCSDGAVLATISPSVGAVEPCGSVEVSPAETTTYTLEVSSSEGIARSSVTVTVVAPVRQRSARP